MQWSLVTVAGRRATAWQPRTRPAELVTVATDEGLPAASQTSTTAWYVGEISVFGKPSAWPNTTEGMLTPTTEPLDRTDSLSDEDTVCVLATAGTATDSVDQIARPTTTAAMGKPILPTTANVGTRDTTDPDQDRPTEFAERMGCRSSVPDRRLMPRPDG